MKRIDLTGQQFGRLNVIEWLPPTPKDGHYRWRCICTCGNYAIVESNKLRLGLKVSCGCYQREMSSIRLKKYNKYNLEGEYGVGIAGKGETFLFDIEDYPVIKDYFWNVSIPIKNNPKAGGYLVCKFKGNKFKTISRLIMNCPDEMMVDHKNHNKLDNRKENLRICTRSQNMQNRRFTGVSFHKKQKTYNARLFFNGKSVNLGCFKTFEEARAVRKEAEKKYFGEFACQL